MEERTALGVIAGEGSFSVGLHDAGDYIGRTPKFALTMSDRDADLVRVVANIVGVGNITSTRGEARWQIQSQDGCEELIEFIEDHADRVFAHSEKWRQFQRWRNVVRLRPQIRADKSKILDLIDAAVKVNPNSGNRQNDPEELKERAREIYDL